MIVRELVTRLGFDADESKVKSFDAAVASLAKGLTALVGVATAASAAALKLANDTARHGDEAAKTARVLGTTAEELQANRFAFDRAGVSASEFTSAMEYMTRQTEYTVDQLPMLLDELAGIENANQRAARAQELFGRSAIRMGTAMAGGADELAALTEEYRLLGGGISDADAALAEQYTDTMTNLSAVLTGLRLQLGARLIPVIMDVVDAFMQFVIVNRDIINSGLDRFFNVAIFILRTFFNIIRAGFRVMDSFAQFLGGWEKTLRLVAFGIGGIVGLKFAAWVWAAVKAVRALNLAMLLNPAVWLAIAIGAAIVAVALLADDLYNFWIGNDSLIGRGIEKWGEFVDKVKGLFAKIGDYFRGIVNSAIDGLYNWVQKNDAVIGMALGAWESFRDTMLAIFQPVFDYFFRMWEAIALAFQGDFSGAIEKVKEAFSGLGQFIWDSISSVFTALGNYFRDVMMSAVNAVTDRFESFKNAVMFWRSDDAGDDLTPITQTPGQLIERRNQALTSRSSQTNNNVELNITTPAGTTTEQVEYINRAVNRSLSQQISDSALTLETR